MKKLISVSLFLIGISTTFFNDYKAQGTTCATASPFCTSTAYSFSNTTGTSSEGGNDYGCLLTQPNPAWFYMEISSGGNMIFDITQTSLSGGGIDVDFILYGPYTDYNNAMANCGNMGVSSTSVDCSYSTAATETATIPSANAGEVYVILITNYSNQAGTIEFQQTGGSASSDCSIVVPICQPVDFHAAANTSPYNNTISPFPSTMSCEDPWIYLVPNGFPNIGEYITPALHFEMTTDQWATSDPSSVNIYSGGPPGTGTLIYSSGLGDNETFTVYGDFLSPSTDYYLELCDGFGDGGVDYNVYDGNTQAVYGSGSLVSGSPCEVFGPFSPGGTASWFTNAPGGSSGAFDNGVMWFDPALAGPGTYNFSYSWDDGVNCLSTSPVHTITVTNPYDATFTYPQNAYCQSAGNVSPTAVQAGATYSASPGGLSINATTGLINPGASSANTYTVTHTLGSGACGSVETFSITINADPTAGSSAAGVLDCNNTTTTVTGTGGGTYSWAGPGIVSGGATATATVNTAGTYTVTVSVAGGCTSTSNVNVTSDLSLPNANSSVAGVIDCNNTTTTVTGTGGGTYSWAGSGIVSGGATATATVNAAGTYTVTVTGANGCTDPSNVVVVSDLVAPTANAGAPGVIDCNNSTINLFGSGGGAYSWIASGGGNITAGSTTATPTVSTAGTYTLTVTAANGCADIDATTVTTDLTAPTASAGADGAIDCTVSTANLTATGGGTYSWVASAGGNITAGAGSATMTGNAAGTYTVTVTAANGCTDTDVAVITSNVTVPTADAGVDQILDCNNATATMTATGAGVGGTYAWVASGGGNITAGAGTATITADADGTYTVTVTAASGCSSTDDVVVTTSPTPTATISGGGPYCAVGGTILDVTIDLTGNGPWTVTYNNGTSDVTVNPALSPYTISNGISGAYTLVSASDNAGCTATLAGSTDIIENPEPIAVVTVTGGNGGSYCETIEATPDIVITFTGTSPWDIIYNTDGVTPITVTGITTNPYVISNGVDGTYDVTSIVDGNGCIGSSNGTPTITTNALPTATIGGVYDACEGSSVPDIGIALTGVAPWSVTYFDGTNSTTISTNLSTYFISNGIAGTYTVTSVSNATCLGVASGVATLTINPIPTAEMSLSGAGTICAGDLIPDIIVDFTGTSPWVLTYTDGVTPVTVTGITSDPYILNNQLDGNYSLVSIVDNTGCTGTVTETGSTTIVTNELPTATLTLSGPGTFCSGNPALIPDVFIALTGTGPWDITYTDGVTPTIVTGVVASPYVISGASDGNYSVTSVSDANCTNTASSNTVQITTNLTPAPPNAGASTTYCFGESMTDLFAAGSGGTLVWYINSGATVVGSGISFPPLNNIGTTTYYISEVSLAGCESDFDTVTIVINDVPTIDSENAVDVSGCNILDGTIDIVASGGTPPLTYSIDGGATFVGSGSFTLLNVGAYPIVVADANCQTIGSTLIIDGPGVTPPPIAGVNATYCEGDPITDLTATIGSGGTLTWYDDLPPTNVVGNNPDFTPSGTTGTTVYSVTETLANCESTPVTITVEINPTPLAPISTGATYCEGDPIVDLTAPPTLAGSTINWYDDAALTNLVGTGQVFSPADTVGTFTYYVNESLNGCTGDSTSVVVIINPTPVFTTVTTNPTTCNGTEGAMLIDSLTPGVTYSVSYTENGSAVPSSSLTANASGQILITGLSAGTYTSVTVSLNGCSTTDNVPLPPLVDPTMPTFTVSFNSPSACGGSDGSITLSDLVAGNTYDVSYLDDGVLVSVTLTADGFGDVLIDLLDQGLYTDVTVTFTGCTTPPSAGPYNLVDPNAPVFTIGAVQNPSGCGVADASITITGLDASTTYNLTYNLNGVPVGPISITTDAIGNYVISGIQGGTYTAITIELAGCSTTDAGSIPLVPIYPTPPIAFTDSTYCEGDVLEDLNGIPAFGGTITWYDDAGLTNQVGTGMTYSVLETSGGPFVYYVTETLNNCEGTASTVTINITPAPNAPTVTNSAVYCEGDPISDLVVTPQGAGTIIWYSDAALTNSIGSGATFIPPVTSDTVVYYVVETIGNCGSLAASDTVIVNPAPVASFTPTPGSGNVPLDVYLENTSIGGVSYVWDLGDGTNSILFDPSITYTETGDYTVTLNVTDINGCPGSASVVIVVQGVSTLIIPNIFTPNGDGNNDVFNLTGTNILEIEGTITNRWGQVIYQLNTLEAGWDGRTLSGLEAAEGTYYYIIFATGADGVEYEYQGPFQLIR